MEAGQVSTEKRGAGKSNELHVMHMCLPTAFPFSLHSKSCQSHWSVKHYYSLLNVHILIYVARDFYLGLNSDNEKCHC